jgi:hypothetical protein
MIPIFQVRKAVPEVVVKKEKLSFREKSGSSRNS